MKNTLQRPAQKPVKGVIAELRTGMAIRYKTSILNPDGSVASTRPWKRNLILDQGLNNMAAGNLVCALWNAAAVGTGTTPVKRDGAGTSFSKTGATITADMAFFGSADVGRLFKFDSGEEFYITTYTSDTQVDVAGAGDVGASQGTVWYVNQTGLATETARTSTKTTDPGDNGTTFDGETLTHQRTFLFAAVGGPVTLTEIGWSGSGSPGGNLFGRDLIPGGGDSLLTGQQLKVVVQMTTQISPIVQTAVGNVGTGYDTSGVFMIESVCAAISAVDSSGNTTTLNQAAKPFSGVVLEPASANLGCRAVMVDWTQQTSPTTAVVNLPATTVPIALTSLGYTSGNFYVDCSGTFIVSAAVGDIYGFIFNSLPFGSSADHIIVSQKLTTPLAKANTHTLSVTFRRSWQRILVN